MSDSDDTDVLLLIPPDFFFINTSQSEESPDKNFVCYTCDGSSSIFECGLLQTEPIMSSNHYHLPQTQQSELDSINARLSQMEKNFSTGSEISSISNTTVRSKLNMRNQENFNEKKNQNKEFQITKNCRSPNKFSHSTPKVSDLHGVSSILNISPCISRCKENNNNTGVLQEIDLFLDEKNPMCWNTKDYPFRSTNSEPLSLPNSKNQFNMEKSSRLSDWATKRDSDPLISLSDIWENNDIRCKDGISIQEERLRRQHCEKTIQSLQSKLLEYQQKISVALQVDKTKDIALVRLQEEHFLLQSQQKNYGQKFETLERQNNELIKLLKTEIQELKLSKDCLEKELSQALDLASKFQDKNETLEIKVDCLSKAAKDYQKQYDDLEIKATTSQKIEELANDELHKLKDRLAKAQNDLEKAIEQSNLYKKQLDEFHNEKQSITDKIRHEKNRSESLGKQNRTLSESVSELSGKEKNLLKELELQRNSLKSHYQQQLEKVVEQKLKEFQAQLDTVESNLNLESKNRERLIADRAIKQLEMINEKNEQEITLITEKQHKEIELYRLQLINASKKICDLEEKLDLYRNRRVDIAEKLHTVMETQWQKALEILTSPSNPITTKPINTEQLNHEKLDGTQKTKAENEEFDTPNSSRYKTHRTADRLQAYIEMLLSKSPRDLENLEQILAMPKYNSLSPNKTEKSNSNKPPWK